MTIIVGYKKHTDTYTTYTLATPDDANCTELCTLDGTTYVAVPDGVTLPEQPQEIADSVQTVTLTPELREAIKAASPHCRLIAYRMQERIRALYSAEDEMYLARIAVGQLCSTYTLEPGEADLIDAYQNHVGSCRAWGRAQRGALGL